MVTTVIKTIVARPRPDLVAHLVAVQPPSFPSGHATNSAIVYGTFALIAAERAASPAERAYVAAACIALVSSIGVTRVILGVHWPSDVFAGWAIGCSWVLLTHLTSERETLRLERVLRLK